MCRWQILNEYSDNNSNWLQMSTTRVNIQVPTFVWKFLDTVCLFLLQFCELKDTSNLNFIDYTRVKAINCVESQPEIYMVVFVGANKMKYFLY